MKKFFFRFTGISLIFAAVLGWLASIGGLVLVWQAKPIITSTAIDGINIVDRTLDITENLLVVADDSLNQVENSVVLLNSTIDEVTKTIETTSELTSSIAGMIGDKFGGIVLQTQNALSTMESSAKLVDDTLGLMSSIPFLGVRYETETPLSSSVADLSNSLAPLPASLTDIQQNMESTSETLTSIDDNVGGFQSDILDIQSNIDEAQDVVSSYQELIKETQSTLDNARQKLPIWMNIAAWSITVILIWLVIAQIGLLLQGWEMLRGHTYFDISISKPEDKG